MSQVAEDDLVAIQERRVEHELAFCVRERVGRPVGAARPGSGERRKSIAARFGSGTQSRLPGERERDVDDVLDVVGREAQLCPGLVVARLQLA